MLTPAQFRFRGSSTLHPLTTPLSQLQASNQPIPFRNLSHSFIITTTTDLLSHRNINPLALKLLPQPYHKSQVTSHNGTLCFLPAPLNPPPPPTTTALTLALLTSLGGTIGYFRTGSLPSIIAGLSVGALYALSYLRLKSGQSYGEEIGLLASVVLGGSSIPRAIRLRKPVPIVLAVLAIWGTVVFGGRVWERRI
ncbi:transmembrane proteins 14C-domain-containing protein [Aspergillus karnatakaensis]|uniref:TMEM14 family protein n=1 Tax=Aspergillus karnatakaensis TaxID=1810916 RepID=UPI003CCCD2F3